MGSKFNKKEAARMIKVGLLCTNPSSALRPAMSTVVSMLESRTVVHELIKETSVYGDLLRYGALGSQFDQITNRSGSEVEVESLGYSWDATGMWSSSTSARDL